MHPPPTFLRHSRLPDAVRLETDRTQLFQIQDIATVEYERRLLHIFENFPVIQRNEFIPFG